MLINDRVYGTQEINDPVILELMESAPITRLKRINQAGASVYAIPKKNVTRYEHSVGVMLLLRHFGASIEEQAAGLLHDVPHTAFSHVIDFVFPDKENNHEFHEQFHARILSESTIPAILNKYGFTIQRILDEENFSLLERNIPDLCADRLDYTLRDFTAMEGRQPEIDQHLEGLTVYEGEIICRNRQSATALAREYLRLDETYWSNPREVALYHVLADAIRIGIDDGILCIDDLFTDDREVDAKLRHSGNTAILKKLDLLNPAFAVVEDRTNHNFYCRNKLRYIDPKFLDVTRMLRLSDVDPAIKEAIQTHREKIERGNYIRIILAS